MSSVTSNVIDTISLYFERKYFNTIVHDAFECMCWLAGWLVCFVGLWAGMRLYISSVDLERHVTENRKPIDKNVNGFDVVSM